MTSDCLPHQVAYAEELDVHVEPLEILPSARPQLLADEIEIASPPSSPSTAPVTSKSLPPPASAKSLPPPTTAPPTTAPDVGPAGNKSPNGKGKPGVVVGAKEGVGRAAGKAGAKGGGGSAVVGASSFGSHLPNLPNLPNLPELEVGGDGADPDDVAIPVSSTPWLMESADTALWERLGTARAVVGTKPLILREALSTESAELAKVIAIDCH